MAELPFSRQKILIDLQKLNEHNAEGCVACGKKFTLGETAVVACGAWEGGAKLIHENEAVWDAENRTYVERRCFETRRGKIG
ncbi:MAG: hypothetical protein WAM73_21120 [Desulfobacterales bacterium]